LTPIITKYTVGIAMKATIYHNPRCSKSRQTLTLLEDKGIDLEIIEYLKAPLDEKTLKDVLKKLDMKPMDLMRKGESVFKELKLSDKADDTQALLDAMVENPILVERPIVLANDKASIGRPPESVLEIL
jgi:arsenate reductase (glutaredoxin)